MKKLLLLMLLSICASRVAAQDASNPLGGDIRASSTNCSVSSSCVWQKLPANATSLTVTVANGPVGSFTGTLQFEQSSNGGFNFSAASPASTAAPGVFTFTVTSFTDFRVRASAFASGDASVNIQASGPATGPPGPAGPAGGSSVSPNNGATNPLGVSINTKGFPYSAVGDTQQTAANVSTIAPGSNGCPAGAVTGCFVVPGTLFKQTDIGKTIYFNAASLNVLLPTTIAHVTAGTGGSAGSQMIDVAVWVLTGGCGGICIGVWGTDDTVALQKAAGAIATLGVSLNCQTVDNVIWQPVCARLYAPPGGYMTSGGGTTTPGGPGLPGISTGVGSSVVGSGQNATTFFMRPDYNIGALAAGSGMLLHNPCDVASDFQVTSSGFTFASITANPIISSGCSSTTTARIRIAETGVNSGQLFTIGGTHSTAKDIIVQDPPTTNGGVLLQFNGGTLDVYNFFASNNTSTTAPNLQITNYTGGTTGGSLTIHGGFVDECNVSVSTPPNACTMVVGSKQVGFFGTRLLGGAFGSVALSVDATSEVRLVGATLAPFGGNTSTDVFVASGGRASATMSQFIASGASSANWNCATVTSCFDGGENIYTQTNSATLYAAGTSPPTFQVANNATSQLGGQQVVNGNVPTGCSVTGNGTSTCAFDTGSTDAAGHITITAAGTTTAVGLVSFSFSRTYGTNSTTCSGNYQSGTGTWAIGAVAPIFITSTTAGASFNINNAGTNLTATSTYKVNYTCYGQ